MKTRTLLLSAAVVGLLAGGVYWSRLSPDTTSGNASGKSQRSVPPVPVNVAQATLRDMPLLLELVGRGEAFETVTLKSRIDGQVAAVPFNEGQQVAAGDVLVKLDPADFNARLRQAEAALARDRALLKKNLADVERYQSLRAQGFVSEEKVLEMRANADAAQATVAADTAALDLARLQLGYTTLRAPFSGIVGAKLVFPGAAVKINDTALAVVNRVRPLYVSFAAPERYLPRIRAAMSKGAVQASVTIPGEDGPAFPGVIRFIDNAVDPATGTIRMKAELDNSAEKLAPGQYLNLSLVLDVLRDSVVVPKEAVQQGPNGAFVYVLKADAGTEVRKVELALTRNDLAVIAKGLSAGETVVTDGHLRLTPGGKVKVKAPARNPADPVK
ncbi:MAG: efflux transporter periplasmic adaptor subunit [Hydrogenophilales bacterium 28-61-23]|nr:MAG: efflux transporter periplasmic adaptor subunit [Hydrogenophilales bacterium 28-61-23]